MSLLLNRPRNSSPFGDGRVFFLPQRERAYRRGGIMPAVFRSGGNPSRQGRPASRFPLLRNNTYLVWVFLIASFLSFHLEIWKPGNRDRFAQDNTRIYRTVERSLGKGSTKCRFFRNLAPRREGSI